MAYNTHKTYWIHYVNFKLLRIHISQFRCEVITLSIVYNFIRNELKSIWHTCQLLIRFKSRHKVKVRELWPSEFPGHYFVFAFKAYLQLTGMPIFKIISYKPYLIIETCVFIFIAMFYCNIDWPSFDMQYNSQSTPWM